MRLPAGVAAVMLLVPAAGAAPVQGAARATAVGPCYPDHADARLWYLPPPSPVLGDAHGGSTVELTLFRYHGSRFTGDAEAFRGGGILQFRLRFPEDPGRLATAARLLGGGARVVPLTLSRVEVTVVLPGVSSRSVRPARPSGDGGGAWEERAFTLRLTPADQALLRRAWKSGATTISVNVAGYASMLVSAPDAATAPVLQEVPVLADAIPVTIPAGDPRIRRVELDARIPADYTTLDIGCADIRALGGAGDTAAVVAQVRAPAVNGDALEETVTFRPGSPVVQSVRFRSAVKLDQGYAVWIGRRLATGELETIAVRRIPVWQGFLDICSRSSADRPRLDPKDLY